jgi:hypothetical protein
VAVIGRFFSIIILAITLNSLLAATVFAGFFGSDEKGKSGLDLNGGYDVNTVATRGGQVVSAPYLGEKENIIVGIRSNGEILNICLGPGSYWDKKGIAVNLNDELNVKGSKAQGQDGKSYLLAQKLVNKTTGAQVELRNDKGDPVWSGRNAGSTRMGSPGNGMRNQGGGMMRSGGGMMRH